MKSVVFMAQKGGSGKTTLAVHVAVAALQSGEKVGLVDTDAQGSATAWVSVREQDTPVVATITPSQLPEVINAARGDDFSLLLIDTAPHAAPDAAQIVSQVDSVIIPCRPTAFDLAAVSASADIAKAAGKPAAFVLNACPARAPEVIEAVEALKGYGLMVCPVTIGDRRAFSRAVASGRAVTEFEAQGKAAGEVRELWEWIKEHLG